MTGNPPLGPSAHVDRFARDNLPRADQWPVIDTSALVSAISDDSQTKYSSAVRL